MTTIRNILKCLGCVLGGAFAASMLKVLIGVVAMYSCSLDVAAGILDTANVPVALTGGLFGAAVFLRSIKRQKAEQLKRRSPNQSSDVTARQLAEHQR